MREDEYIPCCEHCVYWRRTEQDKVCVMQNSPFYMEATEKGCCCSEYRCGVKYALENHPNDSRVKIRMDGICQTLSTRMGTGGGNVPMVLDIKGDV